MTYLEAVNKVLRLLREPTVSTTVGADDVVADMVIEYVNDAKRIVEGAHAWNSLRYEWDVTVTANTDLVSLPGSQTLSSIDFVLTDEGQELRPRLHKELAKLKAAGSNSSGSFYYAVDGIDNNRDAQLRVYPAPAANLGLIVHGHKQQADLSSDDTHILVPAQPVVYYALAMAARERGEVGGQTAAEIFQLASTYLSDAIARDAALNQQEFDWIVG